MSSIVSFILDIDHSVQSTVLQATKATQAEPACPQAEYTRLPPNPIRMWAERHDSCPLHSSTKREGKPDSGQTLYYSCESSFGDAQTNLVQQAAGPYAVHFTKLPLMIWLSSSDGPATWNLSPVQARWQDYTEKITSATDSWNDDIFSCNNICFSC